MDTLFTLEETETVWVVRNPITGMVHYQHETWAKCDDWVVTHHEARYVVIEKRDDYKPFKEYVRLGLLRNAPVKTRRQTEQMVLL